MHCGENCAISARPEHSGVANIYIVRQGHLQAGGSENGYEKREQEQKRAPDEIADPTVDGRYRVGSEAFTISTFSTRCWPSPVHLSTEKSITIT